MTTTAKFEVTRAVEGQANGATTYNEGINRFDSVIDTVIVDRDLTAPPGSPTDGDCYLVKATATGSWASHDGEIAIYYSGWTFVTPFEGMRIWVADEDKLLVYDGSSWNEILNHSPRPSAASGSISTGVYNSLSAASFQSFVHTEMWLVPVWVDRATTIDALACISGEAVNTGTTIRLGIYDTDGSGEPNNLLAEGTIAAGSLGLRTVAASLTLQPGLYWLAFQDDNGHPGNASIQTSAAASCIPVHQAIVSNDIAISYLFKVTRSYAAFPNPFSGTIIRTDTANPPMLAIQIA